MIATFMTSKKLRITESCKRLLPDVLGRELQRYSWMFRRFSAVQDVFKRSCGGSYWLIRWRSAEASPFTDLLSEAQSRRIAFFHSLTGQPGGWPPDRDRHCVCDQERSRRLLELWRSSGCSGHLAFICIAPFRSSAALSFHPEVDRLKSASFGHHS